MVQQGIFDPIAKVLGFLMKFIYFNLAFENYGVAIIIFTIIMRLLLLPLNIKQTKSMAGMQKIQPELQKIQKKYKNDKEKLNQATMDLYSKHKVNPAGGCLPLLLQMPILFSLYYVIRQPLKFMFGFTEAKIEGIANYIISVDESYKNLFYSGEKYIQMNADLPIIKFFANFGDNVQDALVRMKDQADILLESRFIINMKFLGINLGEVPSWKPDIIADNPQLYLPLLIIPILAGATTFISSKYMQSTNPSSGSGAASGMSKNMMYFMPVMTLFFTFSLPAGLGLYWITGNIVQIVQQTFMKKYIHNKEEEEIEEIKEKKETEEEEKKRIIEERKAKREIDAPNMSKEKIKNLKEKQKEERRKEFENDN